MSKTEKPSPFAKMLRELLEYKKLTTHDAWAQILFVTPDVIHQWLNDEVLPRPENLRGMFFDLMEDSRVPDELLERFEQFASQPAHLISPHGAHMGPTLGHYMTKPLRQAFSETLDTISPALQEQVLLEAGQRCRDLRGQVVPSIHDRRNAWLAGITK